MFRIAARDVVPTLHVGSCTFNKQQCYLIKPPRYAVTHHQTHLCAGRPANTVSACWRRLGTAGGVGLPHRQRHHQRSGSALQNIANTEHLASPPPLLLPPLIGAPRTPYLPTPFLNPPLPLDILISPPHQLHPLHYSCAPPSPNLTIPPRLSLPPLFPLSPLSPPPRSPLSPPPRSPLSLLRLLLLRLFKILAGTSL